MRLTMVPIAALLAAAAGCTPTPAQTARAVQQQQSEQIELATALKGLVPGKPTTCLDNYRSYSAKAYGAILVYRVSNSLVYTTDTGGGCSRVGRGDILITRSPTGRNCAGDISQTIDNASRMPTGSCSFGEFTPYRKP